MPFDHHALPRQMLAIQLEPRMMFDAAAAATAAEVSAATDHIAVDGDTSDSGTADSAGTQLTGVETLISSHDGTQLFAIANDTNNGESRINVFSVGDDGALTLEQTFSDSDNSNLTGALTLESSDDGNTLFILGDSGVSVYNRPTADGEFALITTGATEATDAIAQDLAVSGDTLYVSAQNAVYQYSFADDALTLESTVNLGDANVTVTDLLVNDDTLYIASSNSATAISRFTIGDDGTLTAAGSISAPSGTAYTQQLRLSHDGSRLYALDNNGTFTLQSYDIADDGTLSATGDAVTLGDGITDIAITPDDSALIAVGSTLDLYSLTAGDTPVKNTDESYFASDITGYYSYSLGGIAVSADGSGLYVGLSEYSDGVIERLDLASSGPSYTEGSDPVALLATAELHDATLDSADNYQGASLVIGREGDGASDDLYSFADANGLTLLNGEIQLDGESIASFSQSDGTLTVTFTGATTQATAQQLLRQITYSNTSNDPTANGSNPTLDITFNASADNSATLAVSATLIDVNDPATGETTPLDPTFTEEGESVGLFSNTTLDTVESGQQIWRVVLTLDSDGSNEQIRTGSQQFSLDSSGTFYTADGTTYLVSHDGSTTTLTIYLLNSPADAANYIDQLTYWNSGSSLDGQSRTIGLSVVEYPTPDSTDIASTTVTLEAPSEANTAPVITAGDSVTYTEGDAAIAIAGDATLSDAQMDAFNGGEGNYAGAVLTIALGDGASSADTLGFANSDYLTRSGEQILKDGTVIARVQLSADTLILTFTDANGAVPTTADVQAVLQQVTYSNSSHAPVDSVAIGVTLTDQRGLTSDQLTISLDITAVNDLPEIHLDPNSLLGQLAAGTGIENLEGVDSADQIALSNDGRLLVVADDNANIAVFSRDADSGELTYLGTTATDTGLTSVNQLVVSADGSTLFVHGMSAENGNQISVFTLNADGTLTELASTNGNDSYEIWDTKAFAVSSDGQTLYQINMYDLNVFQISDGNLSLQSSIYGNMFGSPYLWSPDSLKLQDNHLYITSQNGLIVYATAADGSLTLAGQLSSGATDANGNTAALAGGSEIVTSADGSEIFIHDNNGVQHFHFDSDSQTLTFISTALSDSSITHIALAADGNALSVSRDGSVTYYGTAGTQLTELNTLNSQASTDLVMIGSDLYALGQNSIEHFTQLPPDPLTVAVGAPGIHFTDNLTLSDIELDNADSYNGASISITGSAGDSFNFTDSDTLTLNDNNVQLDGTNIASFSQSNGVLTLTFTADVDATTANTVLHLLTYSTTTAGSHTLTLVMNDGEDNSASQSVQIQAFENSAPVFSNISYQLPAARASQPYSATLPDDLFTDADGDALTLTLSNLPDRLSFDATTRTLSGTPTTAGEITLTLTASDGADSTEQPLTLKVAVANTAPEVTATDLELPAAQQGQSYAFTLPDDLFTDADGDALTLNVDGLPAGLSFNPDTRTVSGTPTGAGTLVLTVIAQDALGGEAQREVSLTIDRPAVNPVIDPQPTFRVTLVPPTEITQTSQITGNSAGFDPILGNATVTSAAWEPPAGVDADIPPLELLDSTQSLIAGAAATDQIYQLSAQRAPNGQLSYVLPARLTQNRDVQLRLGNGLPLPSWMQFDGRRLHVDSQHAVGEQVNLRMVVTDASGDQHSVALALPLHTTDDSAPATPLTDSTDTAPLSLQQQLEAASRSALLSQAQTLITALNNRSVKDS